METDKEKRRLIDLEQREEIKQMFANFSTGYIDLSDLGYCEKCDKVIVALAWVWEKRRDAIKKQKQRNKI